MGRGEGGGGLGWNAPTPGPAEVVWWKTSPALPPQGTRRVSRACTTWLGHWGNEQGAVRMGVWVSSGDEVSTTRGIDASTTATGSHDGGRRQGGPRDEELRMRGRHLGMGPRGGGCGVVRD